MAINEDNNEIVGHIFYLKYKLLMIINLQESLALAPLSVLPEYQNNGIGRILILEALNIAKELGYNSVVGNGAPK